MKKNKISNNVKIFIVSFILLFLIFLIIYARNFRSFYLISLMKNNKDIFTTNDLVIKNIKLMDNEEEVEKEFGKPIKEKEILKNSYNYKIKEYKGLVITLKENYDKYSVVKVEVTNKKYKTGRKIRVGNRITKVFRKYKVENKKGSYIYGKYTLDSLKDKSISKEIYLGYRDKNKVEYIDRDPVTNSNDPTLVARIIYEYKYGKITKITWSYDIE